MDAGGKRCLPTWMLKKSAPEELQEPGNGESHVPFQCQAHIQASLQKMKATVIESGEEFPRQETKKLDESPGSLSCSETRKRSRKSCRLDVNRKTTSHCKSRLGRKKAPERKAAPNRSATRERSGCEKLKQTINESGPENDVDLESLFLAGSDNDVGLTVEDLVSMAEEYVNADKEKQYEQKANEESKSEAHNPHTSFFSKNNFGVLCGAAQSGPHISKCTTSAYSCHVSAADMVETAPVCISRTGGVAQDMLDVFLGPLLRIPREERKLEGTRTHVTAACEFSVLRGNNIARDVELPPTKKKSSLKDKVAIFLTDSGRTNAP